MIITNRILAILGLVIALFIIILLVYFRAFAEVTPSPVTNSAFTQEMKVDKFTSISNGRGLWRINIEPADTQSISIFCGDNIFDNYLDIHVDNGLLVLDLDHKFKYENMALMDVWIKTPDITAISPQKTSVYWLKKIECDSLRVSSTGASLAIIDTCSIENLDIFSKGNTSVKIIEGIVNNINYAISDSSIVEMSMKPEKINGTLTGDSFIKIKNKSILTPEKELVSQKIRLKSFTDLPIIENADKLDEYMKDRYGVTVKKTNNYIQDHRNRFLDYFFSHLGRSSMINPVQSYTGGEFLGQEVYSWSFFYIRGTISQINIFYPERTDLDTLVTQLSSFYGSPDEGSNDRYHTVLWKYLKNGIDSSGKVWINQGVDSSLILGFNLQPPEVSRLALEEKWTYYNYSWIGSVISKNFIEREFLSINKSIANKRLGHLLLFYN